MKFGALKANNNNNQQDYCLGRDEDNSLFDTNWWNYINKILRIKTLILKYHHGTN